MGKKRIMLPYIVISVTFSVSYNKSVNAGFHVIATIAAKQVQRSLRSYGNQSPAIVATTIAETDFSYVYLDNRSDLKL